MMRISRKILAPGSDNKDETYLYDLVNVEQIDRGNLIWKAHTNLTGEADNRRARVRGQLGAQAIKTTTKATTAIGSARLVGTIWRAP